MSTSEPPMETIGNYLPFISLVYIAALLPWGFFYIHDFISERWSTIRSTIRAGVIHIFAILLPMPLILSYIVFQQTASQPDHKEMWAALIALALSAYHLARTIWGLIQLLQFRRWAIATALVMERAAYRCIPPVPPYVPPLLQSSRRSSSFSSHPISAHPTSSSASPPTPPPLYSRRRQLFSWFRRPKQPQHYHQSGSSNPILPTVGTKQRSSFSSSFNLPRIFSTRLRRRLSSETISGIKNLVPLNMGHIRSMHLSIQNPNNRCPTHDPNPVSSSSPSSTLLGINSTTATAEACANPMTINASRIGDKRLAEIEDQVSLMRVNSSILDNEFIGSEAPRTRLFTSTFINPHDAFARWSICYLAQFGSAWLKASRARLFDKHSWDGRRYNLASEVWATAALRMETSCFQTDKGPNSPGILKNNSTQVSFLAPALWHFFLPAQSDHLFSMCNLLRKCMLTGEGFPHGRPIIEETEAIPPLGMYRGLIKDVLADLKASFYDVVDGITPEQLHWFAIFVWVGQWNGCDKHDETLTNPNSGGADISPVSPFSLDDSGEGTLKPAHAPVRTLQDQLGLDDEVTLDRCSFPFIRQRYGRYLWRNRSVLQVSGRIDNWLSLRIGNQFYKLFKQYTSFGGDTESFAYAHAMVQDEENDGGERNVDCKEGNDDVGNTGDENPGTGSNGGGSSYETGKYRQSPQTESGPFSTQQFLLPLEAGVSPTQPNAGVSWAQPEAGSSSAHQIRLPPQPEAGSSSAHQVRLPPQPEAGSSSAHQVRLPPQPEAGSSSAHQVRLPPQPEPLVIPKVQISQEARQRQLHPLLSCPENSSNDRRSNSGKRSDRIFNFHCRFEINRLRYQLARIDVPLLHLDQGITFMGCAMETVRSFLAEDVRRHVEDSPSLSPTPPVALASPLTPDSLWSPRLSPDECVSFLISAQLVECLHVIKLDGDGRFDSTVQERLLWECQNGLVCELNEDFSRDERTSREESSHDYTPIRAPHKLQLIMLAILSFPGLRLTHVHHPVVQLDPTSETTPQSEQQTLPVSPPPKPHLHNEEFGGIEEGPTTKASSTTTHETNTDTRGTAMKSKTEKEIPKLHRDALSFVIEAPAAPQKVSLAVDASATSQRAQIYLQFDSSETHFRWQDWRDAFLGRLSGKAEWQRTHFMRNLHVNRTDAAITSLFKDVKVGEERAIPLWVGWEPFRARIRKFELQHSSLIIVGHVMPPDTAFSPDVSSDSGDAGVDSSHRLRPEISHGRGTGQPRETNRIESQPPRVGFVRALGADAGLTSRVNDGHAEGAEQLRFNRVGVGGKFPYFEAEANALSDASMHVDSVLRLNSSLFDGPTGRDLKELLYTDQRMSLMDYEIPIGFEMASPRRSFDGSSGDNPVSMTISTPGGQPDALLDRVNAQDPKAMAILATCLLEGTKPFRRDSNRAIALMERSIAIGKDIRTANLFIKTLLDPSSNSGKTRSTGRNSPSNDREFVESSVEGSNESSFLSERNEGVRRALAIVDLLWRDMPSRFQQETNENGLKILKPKRNSAISEERRMKNLVDLHLKVIHVRRTADVMCDLGNQLSTWGMSKSDELMAIKLYESAIIADCNVWAMVGLALKNVDRDNVYAKKLLSRAIRENWSGITGKVGEDATKMSADRKNDVREYVRRLCDNGDARATKLLQGT